MAIIQPFFLVLHKRDLLWRTEFAPNHGQRRTRARFVSCRLWCSICVCVWVGRWCLFAFCRDCFRLYFLSSAAYKNLNLVLEAFQSMLSNATIKNGIRRKMCLMLENQTASHIWKYCRISLCPAWGSPPSCSMSSTGILIAALISMVRISRKQSQSVDNWFLCFYRYLNRCPCTTHRQLHPMLKHQYRSIFSICNFKWTLRHC